MFLLFHIIPLLLIVKWISAETFTMGVMLRQGPPYNEGSRFENTASAITIAVDDFQEQGWLQEHTFRVVHFDDECSGGTAAVRIARMFEVYNPDVILGGECDLVVRPVGNYVAASGRPYLPAGGSDERLVLKKDYTTLIMTKGAGLKLLNAAVGIFKYFGWRTILTFSEGPSCGKLTLAMSTIFNDRNLHLAELIMAPPLGYSENQLEEYLDRFQRRGRVLVLCIDDVDAEHRFIRAAHARGMTSPEYAIIHLRQEVGTMRTQQPWATGAAANDLSQQERLKAIYTGHKELSVQGVIENMDIQEFYDQIPLRLMDAPWNYNDSYINGWKGTSAAVHLYDMTLTYLTLLNDTLSRGQDPRDGQLYLDKARNLHLQGLQNRVVYDANADRDPDFWFYSLSPQQDQFTVAMEVLMSEPLNQRFVEQMPIFWRTLDGAPPPDIPTCGLSNELCPEDTTVRNAIIIGGCAGFFLILLSICIWVYMYRKKKFEAELQQMLWKINFQDIQLKKGQAGSRIGTSHKSMQSGVSGVSGSKSDHVTGATNQIFTDLGVYDGKMVAIRRATKESVTLTREDLLELNAMREMKDDNLNQFVGACPDLPNICYVMVYCPKGSLQDIIENDDIKLDWMFKISLMSDLSNGLDYLAKSAIHSHGNLKSSNCLVDGRWVLKISGYGLRAFRSENTDRSQMGEYELYRRKLWTAPELLRMRDRPHYGTPEGDVYAFAVILQELNFRSMPYFLDTMAPKEVVERVVKGEDPPFRPKLPEVDSETNPDVVPFITSCWAENPEDRPNWTSIKKSIRHLNMGKKINIMDNMIKKLERYANNLEDIVTQRTAELGDEKKRSDMLLYNMIPQSVADELRNGRKVDPELFEEVTVFFSDVVGFVSLASESTPIEVVDLLNDLYGTCDDLIDQHDVYKVETISDSYMVVSGLPHRNGERHVGEIANLALDMMSAVVTSFRIRHRPETVVRLRVGMHTGPCAAGVVGLTMPRYCLFGDTVNMSSRMETNGKALRIHMSQSARDALTALGGYDVHARGQMEIKGKGIQTTYWLQGKDCFDKPLPEPED